MIFWVFVSFPACLFQLVEHFSGLGVQSLNFVVWRVCITYCSLFTMFDAYFPWDQGNCRGGSPGLLRSLLRTFLSEESQRYFCIYVCPIRASPSYWSKATMQEQNEPSELATTWRLITQRTLNKVRLFHVKTSMVSVPKLAEGEW